MSEQPGYPLAAPARRLPPPEATEREMLTSFLDFQRATLVVKCTGLTAAAATLDASGDRDGLGTFTLRWILIHLIEEYARHNGHADLIRERLDGVTGQ
jgi:hypothetical protein